MLNRRGTNSARCRPSCLFSLLPKDPKHFCMIWIRIRVEIFAWIRIQKKPMRIRNTAKGTTWAHNPVPQQFQEDDMVPRQLQDELSTQSINQSIAANVAEPEPEPEPMEPYHFATIRTGTRSGTKTGTRTVILLSFPFQLWFRFWFWE